MTFWRSAETKYGGLLPYPGMPVRVRYTPDRDAAFGSAKEIRLRDQPGSVLATLDTYLLFHPPPREIGPEMTVTQIANRYPFLSEQFIRQRFFYKGKHAPLYYETFPQKRGVLVSKYVSGDEAMLTWEGVVSGSEVGVLATKIHYRMVRLGGRWQIAGEQFQ